MVQTKVTVSATGGSDCHVGSYCINKDGKVLFISYYTRERQTAYQVGSALMLGLKEYVCLNGSTSSGRYLSGVDGMRANHTTVEMDGEIFVHSMAYPKGIRGQNRTFMTDIFDKEALEEGIYAKLMELYDLPLLREWGPALTEKLMTGNYVSLNKIEVFVSSEMYLSNKKIVEINHTLTQEKLDEVVTGLLKQGLISSGEVEDGCLNGIESIDDFYINYGKEIVEEVSGDFEPLVEKPEPKVDVLTLLEKVPFPQQAYIVNALREVLKVSPVAFMNEDMGTGKTLQSISATEAYHIDKYLRTHKGATKEEAVLNTKYRVMVLCPSHLVEKWAASIIADIPGARATVIRDFAQVVELSKQKGKRPSGKDFYILSKDKGKLSYLFGPMVGKKRLMFNVMEVCTECGRTMPGNGSSCYNCRTYSSKKKYMPYRVYQCPTCNTPIKNKDGHLVGSEYFKSMTDKNYKCPECNSSFWGPYVQNINGDMNFSWIKEKVRRNRGSKHFVTQWVPKGKNNGEPVKMKVSRKYAPADYIAKKCGRNFFDMLIVDEVHAYKGGDTAQGRAMHLLHNTSKKTLALTGTLAGGYANHLFYTFWRLIPNTMQMHGWTYDKELEFTKVYGTIEQESVYDKDVSLNSNSKGAKIVRQPRPRPGISGLIYTDFLFPYTVFLSMEDLAAFLPPYVESVVPVELEGDLHKRYNFIREKFKQIILGDRQKGAKVRSTMLQTLLAFPDKPYGFDDILDPDDGEVLISMKEDEELSIYELLPKEKELVRIINKEMSEERNCFVYAEYTGKGDKFVIDRLMQVIEYHCGLKGKVAFLKSESPASEKREAWIHERASKGIKVFVTNPRLVETGLDFVFDYNGKRYNYPTLIFYQIGTNLFTVWQAAKRAYRLIQTVECRTYYMAYKDTFQWIILTLMGKKKAATSALQGKFSSDALCTNSGPDVTHALVNSLKSNISGDSVETLDAIFRKAQELDVSIGDDDKAFLEAMKNKASVKDDEPNILDMVDQMLGDMVKDEVTSNTLSLLNLIDAIGNDQQPNETFIPQKKTKRKRSTKKTIEGQVSMFE